MTTAEKVIKPKKAGIFRTVFLYTGQGESTLLVIPTGMGLEDYKYVLVDSDKDNEKNEIDLVSLFKDLFATSGELELFINTHPHNDHIGGIKEVYEQTEFKEVWHSNHKPGGKHAAKYQDFKYVIDKVGKANEFHLKGTNDLNKVRNLQGEEVIKKLGNVDFIVLSPAEYLCDDIDEADADERNKRIHEQCGVMKFTYGQAAKSILLTGDSDKEAWQAHITKYHSDKLPSSVLSASHHGSRTFFKTNEDDKDVFENHLQTINPDYLVISAPRQEDSPHGHPHDDAMKIYKKYLAEEKILHLGKNPESVIVDIDDAGNLSICFDKELIAAYGGDDDGKGESSGGNTFIKSSTIGAQRTRLDNKPMGK